MPHNALDATESAAPTPNTIVTDEEADKLRAILRAKLGQSEEMPKTPSTIFTADEAERARARIRAKLSEAATSLGQSGAEVTLPLQDGGKPPEKDPHPPLTEREASDLFDEIAAEVEQGQQSITAQVPQPKAAPISDAETTTDSPSTPTRETTERALDELMRLTREYKQGDNYWALIRFVTRFRQYSPYNAMLIHLQKPGSSYVARARQWDERWRRDIKLGARPIVILQPMGPVMFVYDVNDTEARDGAPPLPPEIECPFDVTTGVIHHEYDQLIENMKRDGIRIVEADYGSQSAGMIRCSGKNRGSQDAIEKTLPNGRKVFVQIPVRYELAVNRHLAKEARYVTVVHELGHLYCGHLGTLNPKWWPDRRGGSLPSHEFEAESVAYLVCARLGIQSPSEKYLAGYVKENGAVPPMSVECVMRSAGLIESMSRRRLPLRKEGSP